MIQSQKKADMVFVNGKIYTVDKKNKWAQAVAVKDKKIIFVGSDEEGHQYISDDSKMIDLNGKVMLPGFFDCHVHPTGYVHDVCGINLVQCKSIEEYQIEIKKYSTNNPDKEVILGFGWFHTDFDEDGPNTAIIDEIVNDRPVLLYSGDVHNLWVNSKALEIAGIHKDTKEVKNGVIVRDENGNPTGCLNEFGAMQLVEKHISGYDKMEYFKTLKAFQKKANQVGITTIHDAGMLQEQDTKYSAYKHLDASEALTLRVRLSAIIYPNEASITEDISFAVKMREDNMNNSERLQTNTVKVFLDGVPEADTALLEQPYIGSENYGMQLWQEDSFKKVVGKLDEKQFQIHVHSMGDKAIRYTLDAFEYAENINGERDSRHLIAHVMLVNEQDFIRFKNLNIIPVVQPFWFEKTELYDDILVHNLGKERANRQYPMKRLLDIDVKVACGSDGPVAITESSLEIPFNPLIAIQQGITRCNFDKDHKNKENILYPEERVTLEQMIEAVTINSAYACFLEDVTGSIETGKYADFVVLENNIFEIPVEEIARTEVLLTVLEGKVVYNKQ